MIGSLSIGIIGAKGWLGSAIATSLLKDRLVPERNLTLSYRGARPELLPEIYWTQDNQELADRSDVIIVSVRPHDWPALGVDARGKLIISVMAGIPLRALTQRHNTRRVVRAMPNAAAEVGKSYTPWVALAETSDADRSAVRAIFDSCGTSDEVASEAQLDYLAGLSGSGPAFPALLTAAMMKDAVARGLDAHIARRAVRALLVGAGALLESRDEDPAETVATFVQYAGTTAAAIEAMREAGFEMAVARGLDAAYKRSASLEPRL